MQNLIIDEITKAVWNEFTAKTHNEKRDYQYSVNDLRNVITEAYKNAEALQLQQTGVMARCYEDYIGKKFIYKSKITTHNTIFKVIAHFERCGKTVLVSENNNAYYLHEVRPYNEP